jgi:asparagine synthase (glutamine-hydrolysing)
VCGLVGIFSPDGGRLVDDETLAAMRDRMMHRGPDGAGLWRSPAQDCVLGHRRLSIIDLSDAAGQPMLTPDGRVVLVFNGEIYNHAQLRRELAATGKYTFRSDHSDTEVLLYAFLEWGRACVDKFYGMFAFAIFDARAPGEPVLHLVRDRVGVKPLYFSCTDKGQWVFASEIKAILMHPDVSTSMNDTAFWHYLSFIVSPAPMTMFEGVFKLPPAHWVEIRSGGRTQVHRYWDCAPRADDLLSTADLSLEEASEEFLRLLRASIDRRMVSDVPLGVLLSGGVDSSLNVALMSELMDRPVSSFTIGYEEHDQFNEFEHARKLAKRYGTEHHEARIDAGAAMDLLPRLVEMQDDPVADNVCIPLYFLSKLVRDSGTTVVQVGEGADENFLGYWWCDHYRAKQQDVYGPALAGGAKPHSLRHYLRRLLRRDGAMLTDLESEDAQIVQRARKGQELFWGGAVCWWGQLRDKLTPSTSAFRSPSACPIEGLVPDSHLSLDSHAVIEGYLREGGLAGPDHDVLRKIPYLEHQLRLPEHLLMRVDKMTMAHSVEARVPFLDHDLVNFARRVPTEYKLSGGIGKRLIKKAAEPYIDHDLVYRRKQGFGAPMDEWFKNPAFGNLCRETFAKSTIRKRGYLNNDLVDNLLEGQISGRTNYGFHLWTIMNAVFWHQHWIGDES